LLLLKFESHVGVLHIIISPIGTVSTSGRGEENLEEENIKDGGVGHLHHFGNFVIGFDGVHLNLSLVAGVDNDTDNGLDVTERHTTE